MIRKLKWYRVAVLALCVAMMMSILPHNAFASETSLSMLHTEGGKIVNASGEQITWRGTNLGAWLLQEAWASPLGTGAIDPDFIANVEGNGESSAFAPSNVTDVVVNESDGTETANYETFWMSGVNQATGSSELKLILDKPRTFSSIVLETGPNYKTD